MKKFFILSALLIIINLLQAQVPPYINYQVVIRDSAGTILSNQPASIRLTVIKGDTIGENIYREVHEIQTNDYGLVNLMIGDGMVVYGDFEGITWGVDVYVLETAIDPDNSGSFEVMGSAPFVSVPYAFNSRSLTLTSPGGKQYEVTIDDDGNIIPVEIEIDWQCGNVFTDERDDHNYQTIKIGDQCWMAENLDVGIRIDGTSEMTDNDEIEKYCYQDNPSNCDEYGGLYQWNEMMQYSTQQHIRGICPEGWTLPDDDDWQALIDTLGGEIVAGGKLKEAGTAHWQSPNIDATNESGFTALPGGARMPTAGNFSVLGYNAYFWTSAPNGTDDAFAHFLTNGSGEAGGNHFHKEHGFSVRCIKFETPPQNLPPDTAHSPYPANYQQDVELDPVLSWECSDPDGDPLVYDVYFGMEGGSWPKVASNISEREYDPGLLEENTGYFWVIVAKDDHGHEVFTQPWAFHTGAGTTEWECGDDLIDDRDGKYYQTELIDDKCWMAENLNTGQYLIGQNNPTDNGVIEKHCYANNPLKCNEYGGLYPWNELMNYQTGEGSQGICPEGWHVATTGEWQTMVDFLGGSDVAGGKLKSTGTVEAGNGLWYAPNLGATNESGFTALPGGYINNIGNSGLLGYVGYFWTSSLMDDNISYCWGMSNDAEGIGNLEYIRQTSFSVRCVNDETWQPNQAPDQPSNPTPEDGAQNVSVYPTFSWSCSDPENDPLSYMLFIGNNYPETPLVPVTGYLTETEYSYPDSLDAGTTWYWKIVAIDDHENTTEGPVWQFETEGGSNEWECGDLVVDVRDGKVYETVAVGANEECWFAENINVGQPIIGSAQPADNGIIEKRCYDDDPQNCITYGGLYTWDELMQYATAAESQGICPPGWHVPTGYEYTNLYEFLGSTPVAGGKLKSTGNIQDGDGLWQYPNEGATDAYGFSAHPGGLFNESGYQQLGNFGIFWTSSIGSDQDAFFTNYNYFDTQTIIGEDDRASSFSLRCIKDFTGR